MVSDVSTDYARPTPGPSSAPYDRSNDDGSRFGSHSGYGDDDATLKTRGQKMVPVDWSKTRSEVQRYRGAHDSLSARREWCFIFRGRRGTAASVEASRDREVNCYTMHGVLAYSDLLPR